jgi:SM-20-related protein
MKTINLKKLAEAKVTREPFEFLIVEGFVKQKAFAGINEDFPDLKDAGNFPLENTVYQKRFADLISEMKSEEFQKALTAKFDVNLLDLDQVFTIRAHAHATDGNIHTDAPAKLVTALVYMNPAWEAAGGRLRLLRNSHDIEDFIAEVPPAAGTLLAFKRADNSWHGHKKFVGPRRTVQINWVTDRAAASKQYRPMTFTRRAKKLLGLEA